MGAQTDTQTLGGLLEALAARAARNEIPAPVVNDAQQATMRALRVPLDSPATLSLRRRAEAYFAAVVRRRTVRGSAGPRATARLIASAVVEDLLETGRDRAAVWDELERGWRERLPEDVLEEYRLRLCG